MSHTPGRGVKVGNDYARILGKMYAETPKAVFAAIAVSALTCGGDWLDKAPERIAKEWQILYENGLVQKPVGLAAAIAKATGGAA